MDCGKRIKEEKRGHVALPKRNGKGLSLRCLFLLEVQSWEVYQEGGWTSARQVVESTSECQSAFQLSLETHVLLIRLLKLDYEP